MCSFSTCSKQEVHACFYMFPNSQSVYHILRDFALRLGKVHIKVNHCFASTNLISAQIILCRNKDFLDLKHSEALIFLKPDISESNARAVT